MRRIFVVLSLLLGSILTTNLVSTATVAAAGTTGAYVPLTPTRVADTRPESSNYGTPSVPKGFTAIGDTLRIPVTGRAGIPKDAAAVGINLTAARSLTPGYLTVYACDTDKPNTSNLNLQSGNNLQPGNTVANLVLTEIGTKGDICIFARGITHVIVDLNGYVPGDASPILIAPTRIADTRPEFSNYGTPSVPKGVTTDGATLRIPVTGRAGIPTDASAVAINLTATRSTTPGYLTVYACDTKKPDTSNLNLQSGNTVANLVLTEIGTKGDICIFSRGVTHVIVDLNGYVPGDASPILIAPTRIADTRPEFSNYGTPSVPKGLTTDGATLRIPVTGRAGIPTDASAVAINLTATRSTTPGYLTVYACDTKKPDTSNLNLQASNTVANLVLTEIGTKGDICIFSRGVTHVIVDLNGYVPLDSTTPGCTINGTRVETPLTQAECAALLALYKSTDGPNWRANTGWNTPTDPCTWYKIICINGGELVSIDLGENNLVGDLPAEIGYLTDLESLDLRDNQITSIPAEIGQLANLEVLNLSLNRISSVPAEIGKLTNLTALTFWRNQLTTIPTEVGNLDNLRFLDLSTNQFGTIPTQVTDLESLEYLYMTNNAITVIPAEIGNLTTLTSLGLSNNKITAIPPEVGDLTKLDYLSLWGNRIKKVPVEIGNLSNLVDLNLSENQISGDLSDAFAPLTQTGLSSVNLNDNNCPTASDPMVADWLDIVAPGWRC